jgi:hypothetical protein
MKSKVTKNGRQYVTAVVQYTGTAIMVEGEDYMLWPGNWVKIIKKVGHNMYKVYQARTYDRLPYIVSPEDK